MLLAESIKTIRSGNFYAPNAVLCDQCTPKNFLFVVHPEIECFSNVFGAESLRYGDFFVSAARLPIDSNVGKSWRNDDLSGYLRACGHQSIYTQCIIYDAITESCESFFDVESAWHGTA
ncbi:hypothetical protein [Paraburkholderia sediminicola]|uniref:hypothetical protein n=1 Tax=Paraburkholderia sediminicola TaxID=458836 RepID=UPI0015825451|nr:hypothetical protein [Paraburkholderia sediminicola]